MNKIALVLFETGHVGGVLPYTIELCHGLRLLGCQADIIHAIWEDRIPRYVSNDGLVKLDFGLRLSLNGSGRVVPNPKTAILYKGKKDRHALREVLESYDGIVVCKVPSWRTRKRREDHDWIKALDCKRPVVCVIHDTLWRRSYPWVSALSKFTNAYVAVHPAAFSSAVTIPGRIACVVNPFNLNPFTSPPKDSDKDWEKLCCTAFFRSWKHNDDGIRAVPHLKPIHLYQTGTGIELSYMKAKVLSKKEYRAKGRRSYNHYLQQIGRYEGIWKAANKSGNFHYLGVSSPAKVLELRMECGGSVDWSYHRWGEYFNRITIEAMICRCLPFARPTGISGRKDGRGIIFGPENVVLIPEKASPEQIAGIIKEAMGDKSLRKSVVERNLKKLDIFSRENVAKQMVEALKGNTDVGLFGVQEGSPDSSTKRVLERIGL